MPEELPLSIWIVEQDDAGSGEYAEVQSQSPDFSRGKTIAHDFVRTAQCFQLFGGDSALFLGGFDLSAVSGRAVPGLIQYDMSKLKFINHSTPEYFKNGAMIKGAMQYVPSLGFGCFCDIGKFRP